MKVITAISDQEHLGFRLLKLSCNFKRLELIALVSREKEFKTNWQKDSLLNNYIAGLTDPEEIILFTDGNDAVFMADEEEILTKFDRLRKDLVFSTETSCWPDPGLAACYPDGDATPYRFLNSGGFIGKVGLIRELLADHSFDTPKFGRSNQYLWARKYLQYPEKIGLDSSCQLFHTFSPEVGLDYAPAATETQDYEHPLYQPYCRFMKKWFRDNFQIRKDRIFSKITGTWPCQAHFNGAAKVLMDNEIIDMVLAMSAEYKPTCFVYETE
ncbi:glycosyltransferase domain-containing protein [Puia sp.]|uniref:glycosyltransferase domain-containing protein n=1 Tax=Puia sp. TaxID=2045100 RepID=UPI002F42658C